LAQGRLGNRGRLGKLIYLYRDPEFDAACKKVHNFVDKIVFKALEKSEPHDSEKFIDSKGESERYLFLTEMIKSTRNPKQLSDELLNILLAGRGKKPCLCHEIAHIIRRNSLTPTCLAPGWDLITDFLSRYYC
jgi:hypothetical protein